MRFRKTLLSKRVNAQLQFRYHASGLTSFAGLELFGRYLSKLDLRRRLRDCLGRRLPATDYGVVPMTLLLLALIVTGGRRLRHLKHLQFDPVVARLCGLSQLPSDRTAARWLARFDAAHVDALLKVNEEVSADVIRQLDLKRLTLDVDGSVVSTGLTVEGARRGFNPHRRKVPSYYPITAYEAQSGQLLRVENRPGNIHDGKASITFIAALINQVRCDMPRAKHLEFRMDGAFFLKEILELLDQHRVEYAIKVPFWTWLDLKDKIASRRRWYRVDDDISYFEVQLDLKSWHRRERVLIYRKRVRHFTRKNYQLDLFDPDDGHFEYSAIASNKTLAGPHLWWFMCGRGGHEKAYGELKSGFAFNTVPSQSYHANSAWQVLSVLAFNLTRGLQAAVATQSRNLTPKRRPRIALKSINTLRFEWINRAGLLIRPNGRSTLDVGSAPSVRSHFESIANALTATA
jgi:hypothetical protein